MLDSTFLHLPGVGAAKERQLWERGVRTWADFDSQAKGGVPLFAPLNSGGHPLLDESREALAAGDVDFFAARLPRPELYRLALTFPEKTAFLDIETTGLSTYYHEITLVGVSMGSEYRCAIKGYDASAAMDLLASAKCLITFNGSRFDVPFLRKEIPDIQVPSVHIDLRFFCRKHGMAGGQKAIELALGVVRDAELGDVAGREAVGLWGDYRHGDESALRKLISYNHADVEGMKMLFDIAVERRLAALAAVDNAPVWPRFSGQRSLLPWQTGDWSAPPYAGRKYPLLGYSDLALERLRIPKSGSALTITPPIIIGVDLIFLFRCTILRAIRMYITRERLQFGWSLPKSVHLQWGTTNIK